MNGAAMVRALVENLRPDDVELLLANRGLPSLGSRPDLVERLQKALSDEVCGWEWEQQDVPAFHSEIVTAGASMLTHGNCLYVFGGMDDERQEQMNLWRWNLNAEEGFEAITYRGQVPPKLTAGHYAAVHGDELWVFPGPKNAHMRRVYCLDLSSLRWQEKSVSGEGPMDPDARRNLACFPDGKRLYVLGGPHMDKIFRFEFETRTWTKRTCMGGLDAWTFGHGAKRGTSIFALGTRALTEAETPVEVWELSLYNYQWRKIECGGSIPSFRIHSSGALVGDQWLIHGGRKPGKFNVTNQTYAYDFGLMRWRTLLAEGTVARPREWHTALGLQDCIVVVGGRSDIQEYEPIAISCDTMATAVEILWIRTPAEQLSPTGKAKILAGVKGMMANSHLSDVTLVVEGNRIPAHRHILATHSRVFDRMWSHKDMRETETAEVHIPDLKVSTVKLMLSYMYGSLNRMPEATQRVLDLFKAADKYDIPGLIAECMHVFNRITHASDVAYLLQVAFEHASEELRSVCLEVAATCLPNILVTPSFQELTQTHSVLALNFIYEVTLRLGMPFLPDSASAAPAASSASGLLGSPALTSTSSACSSPAPSTAASAGASPNGKADSQLPGAASIVSSASQESSSTQNMVPRISGHQHNSQPQSPAGENREPVEAVNAHDNEVGDA